MKNTCILILLFFAILSSCSSKVEDENASLKDQIAALTKENENLRGSSRSKEISISDYRRKLEEIDYNLRTIELNFINVTNLSIESDRSIPVEERLRSRLMVIQKLISNSNLKIRSLDENLNDLRRMEQFKSSEVLALERAMKEAAKVLIRKESEFNKKRLELELEVGDLEEAYAQQLAITEELYKILNRAYLYSGSSKDLQKKLIVDERGGFIGIGRVKILNATTPDEIFESIEKDKSGSFTFKSSSIKLITNHPVDSYSIGDIKSGKTITIKDKKAFWKSGNYLIVQTDRSK